MNTRDILTGLLVATALIVVPSAGWAQETPPVHPERGADEGIQVHGRWAIEIVRNGEVVREIEFENALQADGAQLLADLLGRDRTAGTWTVSLLSSTGNSPCLNDSDGFQIVCQIKEDPTSESGELTVTSPNSGDNAGSLILAGSIVAEAEGEVINVRTLNANCDASTAPVNCTSGPTSTFFSGVDITDETVRADDQINVTVEISFS